MTLMMIHVEVAPSIITLLLFIAASFRSATAGMGDPIFSTKTDVDQADLRCASCLAVIDVVNEHMAKKSFDGVESRVYGALDDLCDAKNFRAYDFIPPKMVEGCQKFMDDIDEDVFASLLTSQYSKQNKPRRVFEIEVCTKHTLSCVGNARLNREKPKTESAKEEAQKKSTEKLGRDGDEEFEETVESLIKKHEGKIKQPTPVKINDEL